MLNKYDFPNNKLFINKRSSKCASNRNYFPNKLPGSSSEKLLRTHKHTFIYLCCIHNRHWPPARLVDIGRGPLK